MFIMMQNLFLVVYIVRETFYGFSKRCLQVHYAHILNACRDFCLGQNTISLHFSLLQKSILLLKCNARLSINTTKLQQ